MIFGPISPQEANSLLPIILDHVARVHKNIAEGQILQKKLKKREKDGSVQTNGDLQVSEEISDDDKLLGQIEESIRLELEQIQKFGGIVTNLFPTRIDFLSTRHKQRVYLTWQQGDKAVEYWHSLHDNHRMRHRIKSDEPFGKSYIH